MRNEAGLNVMVPKNERGKYKMKSRHEPTCKYLVSMCLSQIRGKSVASCVKENQRMRPKRWGCYLGQYIGMIAMDTKIPFINIAAHFPEMSFVAMHFEMAGT